MATKKWAKLTKLLREASDEVASDDFQRVDPLTLLPTKFTWAQIIVLGVLEEAANRREWATQLVWNRIEGGIPQADKMEGADRSTEERLSELTRKHLNDLAATIGESRNGNVAYRPIAPAIHPAAAESKPSPAVPLAGTAPTRSILDLPSNRNRGAQGKGRKPGVSGKPAGKSGE